ncbi:MAG: HIT family protein [Anaerolineales bacterium]
MQYILEHNRQAECVFCQAVEHPDEPESLVVHCGELNYVILNRFPYTSGHLMVIPTVHVATIEALDDATRAEMMALTNTAMIILRQIYTPEGFNLGMNIGEAAGAGITEHVHMHIVPRWGGDTNFMSSLGNTRVLPETLDETYRKVRTAWPK